MFGQVLFWGYVLSLSKFVIGESNTTIAHWTSKDLSCDHKIRVLFSSDTWRKQLGGENSQRQDHFFVAVMGQIVRTADGNGVNCTFNNMTYMLTCCEGVGLSKLYSVDQKKWTAYSKFWSYDVFRINIVFSFVNLFFFLLILGWGIHILANSNPQTIMRIEQNGSIEMS